MVARGTDRLGPRAKGMMQNVQRGSQPCCTWREARGRGKPPPPPAPRPAAARRMISLSNALSRQPKVMMSTPVIASTGQEFCVNAALEGERRRPGHHHMPVVTPQDVEIAAVERHRRMPAGQPAAMGGDE